MTPRRRAILIVGLSLLLIGLVIFAVVLLRRAVPPAQPSAPAGEEAPDVSGPVPVGDDFVNPLILTSPPSPGNTAVRQMAELFAERYGSYSNQGDYQNLRDLLPVMTDRYRRETEAFLASAEPLDGQAFEGVTSVKVSTEVRAYDASAGTAVAAVTLQQERTSGSSAPTTGYRSLRLELRLVGDAWKVDAARWED